MSSSSLKPSISSMCTSLITRSKSSVLSLSIRSAVSASLVVVAASDRTKSNKNREHEQEAAQNPAKKRHFFNKTRVNIGGKNAKNTLSHSPWYLQRRSKVSSSMRQTGLSSTASTRIPSGNLPAASVPCVSAMFFFPSIPLAKKPKLDQRPRIPPPRTPLTNPRTPRNPQTNPRTPRNPLRTPKDPTFSDGFTRVLAQNSTRTGSSSSEQDHGVVHAAARGEGFAAYMGEGWSGLGRQTGSNSCTPSLRNLEGV
uniref:Uncharacterized protein n=1 Tax=Oryza brachyantha TaxID=4533 RepID=J3MG99_ORYBR